MDKELKIEVWGRVQGVNFRRTICGYAEKLGLKGYVKNREDGSVEVLAQGKEGALEELLSWIQKAVFPAKVRSMSYKWGEIEKKYRKFRVEKDKSFVEDQAQSFKNLGKDMIEKLKPLKVPNHVVIIPDGNRRWARAKGWHPWVGHRKAVEFERLKELFSKCKESGVKYLTFWTWSTENWDRDEEERKMLFNIFRKALSSHKEDLLKEGIRFRHMGRRDRLPKDIMKSIEELEEETKDLDTLNLQLCMDYGGKDEIVRAFDRMIEAGVTKADEEIISNHLDSRGIPDPDLVIRTSGERRTSGMMVYQAAYAELYFTHVPFPAFDAEEFNRALLEYSARVRRFGGTVKDDLKNVDVHKLVDPDGDDGKSTPVEGVKLAELG